MAKITTTLPQAASPAKAVTAADVIRVLPETLAFPLNVWIGGKLARDGKTSDNLIFLVEQDTETSAELKQYFCSLVEPLGIAATASHAWRDRSLQAMRIYNEGRLIIDKQTLAYKEFPCAIASRPELTGEQVRKLLPQTIPFTETLWLTGSIVKQGWSCKDADILVGDCTEDADGNAIFTDEIPSARLVAIRHHFMKLLGWKVDVGLRPMPEREPIYVLKIYAGGQLCLQ